VNKKVLWQELRRNEFEQFVKNNAIVIIPVASTEQHGDHLPVNTDAYNCFIIAERAATLIDDFSVLVLPPVWTGFSPYHMAYPGTITLKYHTLMELLTQMAISVFKHGFRKILFLNGHGGNENIVAALRTKLRAEENVFSVMGYSWWSIPSVIREMETICESDKGSIGHSGELETSIGLYLKPELVDLNNSLWSQGVVGDPSFATREKGERLINAAVTGLVEKLREFNSHKAENSMTDTDGIFKGMKTLADNWRSTIRM
jgi:creatinine amidohydrolase